MAKLQLPRWRLYGTALALLAEGAHLSWEHFHGGILRHHLLHRADLPAISNGWGLLLLPALAWFLLGRIQARSRVLTEGRANWLPKSVVAGFTGALLFGIALSTCFTHNLPTLTEYLFQGLLLLALLLPVYRAECVLGFVLGMAFVFGVVLPTAVATLIAAFSALIHRVIRPILLRLWLSLKRKGSPTARQG
jgi:hypothetical protein